MRREDSAFDGSDEGGGSGMEILEERGGMKSMVEAGGRKTNRGHGLRDSGAKGPRPTEA
jgi:hypothetical protein